MQREFSAGGVLVRRLRGGWYLAAIRPAGSELGDQKRVMTPIAAITAGADYLVVGRPIVAAANPKETADAIVAEIAAANQGG